jgi:uncharacterized membrane protein YozB (DUF420 family)
VSDFLPAVLATLLVIAGIIGLAVVHVLAGKLWLKLGGDPEDRMQAAWIATLLVLFLVLYFVLR